jgi:hypothetical protein
VTRRSLVDVGRELADDYLSHRGSPDQVTLNRYELGALLAIAALKGYEMGGQTAIDALKEIQDKEKASRGMRE